MGKREKWLRHVRSFIKSGRPYSIQSSQSRTMIVSVAQPNGEDDQILMKEKKNSWENGQGRAEDPLPLNPEPESELTTGETSPACSEIAKATAMAAKAAAVAAKAAAEVVRLTQGICLTEIQLNREEHAAIRIQAAFRGHLARQALRALKGVVKLQAVVRGFCVRRQARISLQCMQTLVRLQARVRARQVLIQNPSTRIEAQKPLARPPMYRYTSKLRVHEISSEM